MNLSAQPVARSADVSGVASIGLLLACLWGPILWRLREAWGSDPELLHGVAVPFMALYLAWQRYRLGDETPSVPGRRRGGAVAFVAGLFGVWLMALVLEINALWPRAQWLAALAALTGSGGILYWSGGWSRVRRFAFPLCFLTTALSWPSDFRAMVVQSLTHSHADLAAEIVSLLGYAAVVRGNVIEVSNGLIGVEDACAGLRSLQAVWMFALFFGELHLLGWAARLRIIAVALLGALVGNVARTVFLTWRIGVEGTAANEIWHDEAGLAVLLGTIGLCLAYSQWEAARAASNGSAARRGDAAVGAAPWPRVWAPVLIALVMETLLVEVAVRHWYARGQDVVVTKRWALQEQPVGWKADAINPVTLETLLCTSAEQMQSLTTDGASALAAVFRWENDQTAASTLTNSHDPSVCMPRIGGRLLGAPGEVALRFGTRELVFDIYRFETDGRVQTVFNAVWDAMRGESMPRSVRGVTMSDERMARVRNGQRYADRDRIVLVLEGDFTLPAAIAWLEREAPRLLQPTVGNQARG